MFRDLVVGKIIVGAVVEVGGEPLWERVGAPVAADAIDTS
jgi:hypothetical protein